MDERDALWNAVLADPDDDTPRLVFADWLQEHGEEARAEFIRLQIRLAAVPAEEQNAEDLVREANLRQTHQAEWTEPLKGFEGSRGGYYEFRRGFVEGISSAGEVMVGEGDRLFALAPIRELYLSDEEEYGALAECEWLLRLHTLDLKGSGLSHHFNPAPLIQSPHLANLTTLGLGGEDDNGHLDIHGIRALVSSPHLGKLETLDLSGNWLTRPDPGPFELFLTATNLPSLRNLKLRAVRIGTPGVLALLASPLVEQLRVLDLSNNGIGEQGARAVLETTRLTKLERLEWQNGYDAPLGEQSGVHAETRHALRLRFGQHLL